MLSIMSNETMIINVPVGEAVVNKVTENFETHLLDIILRMIRNTNVPSERYNIVSLVLIVFLALALIVLVILKYRHRLARLRKNAGQRDAPNM